MQLGMIGLGRMGANMALRLHRGGHQVVGFDLVASAIQQATEGGVTGASTLEELVDAVPPPRAVWVMVPAGDPVGATLASLLPLLSPGDLVVDGGNSHYRHTQRRAQELAERGVELVDVGVSGGVWGLEVGYGMMVGGSETAVERLRPVLETLAPGPSQGWAHVGPVGAGHFAKMVHNGIEYGLMQAYAEGLAILRAKKEFGFDLAQLTQAWRHGTVIRSWLLDLAAEALAESPDLEGISPQVADSGEGRWTVKEAIDLNVAAPVISLSLLARIESRDEVDFTERMLTALRHKFGGHPVV